MCTHKINGKLAWIVFVCRPYELYRRELKNHSGAGQKFKNLVACKIFIFIILYVKNWLPVKDSFLLSFIYIYVCMSYTRGYMEAYSQNRFKAEVLIW